MNAHDTRKKHVINRMLIDVQEHFALLGVGAPLRDFAGRYARLLSPLGGVNETIDELLADGSLELAENEKGHKFLYPCNRIAWKQLVQK